MYFVSLHRVDEPFARPVRKANLGLSITQDQTVASYYLGKYPMPLVLWIQRLEDVSNRLSIIRSYPHGLHNDLDCSQFFTSL